MKTIVVHVLGVALTFLVSVLVMLVLKGMLIGRPPFIVPPTTHAVADSAAVWPQAGVAPEDAAPAEPGLSDPTGGEGAAAEPHSEYERSPEDSLALALARGRLPVSASPDTSGAEQAAIEDASPVPPPLVSDPANVQRLARVYSKMKPKIVAQIMDSLSDENTLAILTTMNDRVAAKVIAGMDPTNAARLSEMMAKGAVQ